MDIDSMITSLHVRLDAGTKVDPLTGCWLWTGFTDKRGYGRVGVGKSKVMLAHKASYERHRGTVPDGLELDHLCRTHGCVNPNHLEAVTHRENCRRGMAGKLAKKRASKMTHCKRGHLLSGDNLYVTPSGFRQCKACQYMREQKARLSH